MRARPLEADKDVCFCGTSTDASVYKIDFHTAQVSCVKSFNQTNNNAALSERASDLLIYIIHDFGAVVESLNTVISLVT